MKDIELSVSPDLVIKYKNKIYTREQLSRSVAYWYDIVEKLDDRPIGIYFSEGGTTYQTIAFLLAAISVGKEYYKMDSLIDDYPGGVSKIFVVGEEAHKLQDKLTDHVFVEASVNYMISSTFDKEHSLKIKFRDDRNKYAKTSGTTGAPKFVKTKLSHDALSIQCAIDNYFYPDDYCVFSHNMSHVGVHSTAIFPAIFKARVLSLTSHKEWKTEILNATHTQYFYVMMNISAEKFPKNHTHKIRTVTTGGDFLKPELVKYLLDSGAERIIDIYGLTEASPPLAIREIRSIEDLDKKFIWVNKHFKYFNASDTTLFIIRPDCSILKTTDVMTSENEMLTYRGRVYSELIRCHDILYSIMDFRVLMESATGVIDYYLDIRSRDFSKIYVLEKDYESIRSFVSNSRVVLEVVLVKKLPTKGGIKYTR